jgi:hypothetical protein
MNIVSGQSAKKQHLSVGSITACNRKMSIGKNDYIDFKSWVNSNPEICCSKCLAQFNRIKK